MRLMHEPDLQLLSVAQVVPSQNEPLAKLLQVEHWPLIQVFDIHCESRVQVYPSQN